MQYSTPANDDRYAEKGAKSKFVGDQPTPMPGPFNVDPDDMYLTGKKRARKSTVSRTK